MWVVPDWLASLIFMALGALVADIFKHPHHWFGIDDTDDEYDD